MPISSKRFKNLRGTLMIAGAACFFLGVVAYWYTDGFYFPTAPTTVQPQKAVVSKVDTTGTEQTKPTSRVNPVEPAKEDMPAPAHAADAGSVLAFAEKQAQLEVVKLEVAIAEQQAKLKELRDGKPVPLPVSQPVPQPVAVLPAELPPLPPLNVATPDDLPPLPSGSVQPRRPRSGLIGVQGMDGKLSAVFATASGKKTVRVGDSIMGSRVRAISLDGVTLASGKTITIED